MAEEIGSDKGKREKVPRKEDHRYAEKAQGMDG